MSTPPFHVSRDRDAWAAIRGFVYQVQHTILRWLELPAGAALEPEHGEDIDVLVAALQPNADTDRVLEQIKYRERDITLNSAEVRAALSDFYEHAEANASLRLHFRFMTNAAAQRERRSSFPGRVPGINAWSLVSNSVGELTLAERDHLAAIRRTLSGAPKPQDYDQDVWLRFQQFLKSCSDDALLGFIRRIEISVSAARTPSSGRPDWRGSVDA